MLPESSDVCSYRILLLTFFHRASRCMFPFSDCMCQQPLRTTEMFIWEDMHLSEYLMAVTRSRGRSLDRFTDDYALNHRSQIRWEAHIWAIRILSNRNRRVQIHNSHTSGNIPLTNWTNSWMLGLSTARIVPHTKIQYISEMFSGST